MFRRILVPVSGTEADGETMRLACRLAKKDKGKVWAVSVVTVKRALPLDAEIDSEVRKAEDILDRVERVAEGRKLSGGDGCPSGPRGRPGDHR